MRRLSQSTATMTAARRARCGAAVVLTVLTLSLVGCWHPDVDYAENGESRVVDRTSDRARERDLQRLLVPRVVLPAGLVEAGTVPLSNADAATVFPDPAMALRDMTTAGRVGGMQVAYRQPSPTAAAAAVVVSSSVALYRTPTAAATVQTDPGLPAAVQQLGLDMTEQSLARTHGSVRLFRGGSRRHAGGAVGVFRPVPARPSGRVSTGCAAGSGRRRGRAGTAAGAVAGTAADSLGPGSGSSGPAGGRRSGGRSWCRPHSLSPVDGG